MRSHLFAAPTILLTVLSAAGFANDVAQRRPNVIILLTDDQGYGDLSCNGNPVLKTPNFDRLHDESIRLSDFHVAPMCTPTRGQLLTGLDALHSGASSVCAGRSFVRRGITMIPEIFAANGYRTALFGKWHLGDSYPNLPEYHGFKQAVYHLGWGITSMADLWENDYFNGRFRSHGELKQYPGYCTDVWFKLAKDWLKERAASQEPFFLYLPTNAPHGPLWVPGKYKQPYLDKKGPAAFFGMIANIDENLGSLDELLRETGQRDNTIFIYFHGTALPIAKMRLKLGDFDDSKPVTANDKGITFTLPLQAGTRTTMQTWCYDANEHELGGAYFAYVRRK